MRACLSDSQAKFREVRAVINDIDVDAALKTRLEALFLRGAFHHGHDVAYAVILILRGQKSDDAVVAKIANDYVGMGCDPVYPQ
jgi:hypothetical protein